jgi:hypothetical protein
LLGALAPVGCGANAIPKQPVTVVATRTPGVAMVIVRPSFSKSASGELDRTAEYVLLCDARGPQGMNCEVVSEVSRDRRSRGVMAGVPAPVVDEGIGTLSDFSVRHSGDDSVARDVNPPALPPATPRPEESPPSTTPVAPSGSPPPATSPQAPSAPATTPAEGSSR